VMIYPNHGAGSPCGADIGARLSSTIGYERKFNNFLQFKDAKSFTDFAIKTAPPVPRYYPLMKKVNAEGPKVLGSLPRVPGLSANAFQEAIEKKCAQAIEHFDLDRSPEGEQAAIAVAKDIVAAFAIANVRVSLSEIRDRIRLILKEREEGD